MQGVCVHTRFVGVCVRTRSVRCMNAYVFSGSMSTNMGKRSMQTYILYVFSKKSMHTYVLKETE